MPRVLITDAEERATLAATRALSAAGYQVDALAGSRPAATHWSRACCESFLAPKAETDTDGFVDALVSIARAGSYDVLIPGSDAALLAISEQRERIGILTGLPEHDAVLRSLSRFALTEASTEAGWPAPAASLCSHPAQAREVAAQGGYPVILKTPTAVERRGSAMRHRGSRMAATDIQLEAILADFGLPILVQRRVEGRVHSLGGVRAGGEFLGLTFSRYDRTWPPEAGNASASVSLEPSEQLRGFAARLIDALGWQGLFEIELIHSESHGEFAPIDFNPRVYGSMELSTRAGAPLAPIWCDWLLTGRAQRCEGRAGVRYRWEDTELRALIRQLRGGHLRTAGSLMRPHASTAHAHFRLRDPAPMLARAARIFRNPMSHRSDTPVP